MRRFIGLAGLFTVCALTAIACEDEPEGAAPGAGGAGAGGGGGGGSGGAAGQSFEGLYGSGERLQAVILDGGDGAEHLLHFHDDELDIDCDFANGGDGILRCLPQSEYSVRYADSACTEPVLIASSCYPPPAYVRREPVDACWDDHAWPAEAWETLAPLEATEVFNGDGGGCASEAIDPEETLVFAAAPADLTLFVSAEVRSEELDGGFGRRRAVATDGAHRVLGAYDIATDGACNVQDLDPNLDGGPRCLPSFTVTSFQLSSSPTCDVTDVAITYESARCGDPRAIIRLTPFPDPCVSPNFPYERELFAAGPELDAAGVYSGVPTSCTPVAANGQRFFALGDPLPADTFLLLAETEIGSARLQKRALGTPGGEVLTTDRSGWHDSELGLDCIEHPTTIGTRCLPIKHETLDPPYARYADDACTQMLVGKYTAVCPLSPAPYVAVYGEQVACSSTPYAHVYEIGAEHTGPAYGLFDGSCIEVAVTNTTFYSLGAELPLESFAPIEQR